MKTIKLKLTDKIEFTPMTDNYGHAEWILCPVFKYGKLKKICLHPLQQPDKSGIIYEIETHNQKEFAIKTWQHKGMEFPNIWRNWWCKEHKTIAFDFYIDKRCNQISFCSLSCFEILFEEKT